MGQEACIDGVLTEEELRVIEEQSNEVKKMQDNLVHAFRSTSTDVSEDLAEENIFVFSLSFWARKMTDFADEMCSHADSTLGAGYVMSLWRSAQQGLCSTWSPYRISDIEHLKFALRNFIS